MGHLSLSSRSLPYINPKELQTFLYDSLWFVWSLRNPVYTEAKGRAHNLVPTQNATSVLNVSLLSIILRVAHKPRRLSCDEAMGTGASEEKTSDSNFARMGPSLGRPWTTKTEVVTKEL